jgi:hypothetical protein
LETDLLREKYGLPPFHVPPENVHFLPKGDPALRGGSGKFRMQDQAVYLEYASSDIVRLASSTHEMVHFKAFQSVHAEEGKQKIRRGGLRARVEGKEEFAFEALDEAVTEELTKRLVAKMADEPVVSRQRKVRQDFFARNGQPDDPDVLRIATVEKPDGGREAVAVPFTYVTERKALNVLIDKLVARYGEKFSDREQVFDLFASAAFNGYLLELARTIEGAFGEGTFRRIGEFGKDGTGLLAYVESL